MLLSEAVSSDRSENLNAILLATSRVVQSIVAVPVCISLSVLCADHILLGTPSIPCSLRTGHIPLYCARLETIAVIN